MTEKQWQFWIDRGGTFTDIIALDPKGELHTHKLLSENPEQYTDAAIAGIRHFLKLDKTTKIPAAKIASVKMGTTVATNALLERKGDVTALLTNQGFADALQIGYQHRPDIFALKIERPLPLYREVIEVPGRLDATGHEIEKLDKAKTLQALQNLFDQGYRSLAIVFLHSYLNDRHEQQVAAWAKQIGFQQVSTSAATSSLIKYVSRGRTTVVDAYLSPILRRYVEQVAAELPGVDLQFMQSFGGLTSAEQFQGKDAILSGPAGGIVAAAKTAEQAGLNNIIGFDMGGTSTDVSHYAGQFERSFETQVAGVEMRVPMLDIHTVAAGGGSIISRLHNELRVGPESAGANPGPAAYRRGGPLTVTDANVFLGRIQAQHFPKVFGEKADQALDTATVAEQFTDLAKQLQMSPEKLAEGALSIAVEHMANAVQKISGERGYDVADYTLVSFGGAGGQHACAVADKLGMTSILLHPYSGVLSAYGMGLAQKRIIETESYNLPLTQISANSFTQQLHQQIRKATIQLEAQNDSLQTQNIQLHLQYQGSDTLLDISYADDLSVADYLRQFAQQHQQEFGFIQGDTPVMINSVSVEAIGQSHQQQLSLTHRNSRQAEPIDNCRCYLDGKWQQIPLYQRGDLGSAQTINGPALILEPTGTLLVSPNWQAQLQADGQLLMTKESIAEQLPLNRQAARSDADPVQLALFNSRFMAVAEQMGVTLAKTAHSVNIKERLDFSCALFDKNGQLIANAPHVPVHLGSMGESVKTVIQKASNNAIGALKPGDAYVLNNPYAGGTHLPDVTLISPVFVDDKLAFFVASRGHHADIGGKTPGSMPADSRHIKEEGVLLDCVLAVKQGQLQRSELEKILLESKYPVRNLKQNLNDLQAQIAANQQGINGLNTLCKQFGLQTVSRYMDHVLDHAENAVKNLINELSDGEFCYQTDQNTEVCVKITVNHHRQTARIDFSGTSLQQYNNFNAPYAITRAATLYVLRTLVNQPIPLNDGFLRPIDLQVPAGSMLNPDYPAAVVAGNVETSQVVTDTLYGALQIQAASQGTMNNLTFGDDTWQYYETICGGTGGGIDYNGCDAIHSHMTNSRLTDPEVLELRYPVRLETFAIRKNSGGNGLFKGGNGCERHFRFLKPMTVSILSNHRKVAPYGMAGGADGSLGRQYVIKADNSMSVDLASTITLEMKANDTLVMQTPGGGGYGSATAKDK
ncbi:hydantoinase B/oxoprolinase family protein [Thiomicrorhabdus sediminis]|uniref:5-oxoprolinase n=1 Tax=Thiomicrorhabdus sediminis TaxID=2580412 RepID=A0A4P9K710_9GAMM|nr:hydantoinase B/oxoprolinase family protein [Thiomicrorhabdus sediminis]QCU90809.1 5-oxoprolinase [Thiomicrorhabdus sediminis]